MYNCCKNTPIYRSIASSWYKLTKILTNLQNWIRSKDETNITNIRIRYRNEYIIRKDRYTLIEQSSLL